MFLNRRKTIYNNLSSFVGDKELASTLLGKAGIAPTKRPEELSPQDFVSLFTCVNGNSKLFS